MKDRLSRTRTNIKNGAVSVFDLALAGDFSRREMAAADQFGIVSLGLFQSRKMLLGDDEHVRGRLRIDVFKGQNVLVFMNFLRGNLSSDDAAEKTIGIGHRIT